MGTSTINRGQKNKTPLVPSWLIEDDDHLHTTPEKEIEVNRFTTSRTNFTRFIGDVSNGRSGGNLKKATSNYVKKGLGGSQNAAIRLGAARSSTVKLLTILGSLANHGAAEIKKTYNLGEIIGKRASDVLILLIDFVCPDGGPTDEGIVRDSYIDAIISIPELGEKNIEEMTPIELLAFTEIYMSNIIEARLVNDIGNKMFSLPDNINEINDLQQQIKDYISGAVSDAVEKLGVDILKISSDNAKDIVDSIYKKSYDILAGLEE